MRKNANFANHKYALRRILLINILKLKQLVSNLYHFAFGREVHTNGMNADGTMSVAAGDPTLSVTPLKGLEMLPDRIPCENSMLDISEYKQSENPLIFTVEGSSMSPEDISNGDKLLCRKVDTDAAKLIGKGKFVVIAVDKEYYDSKNKDKKELMLSVTYRKGNLRYSFHPVDLIQYVAEYVLKHNGEEWRAKKLE